LQEVLKEQTKIPLHAQKSEFEVRGGGGGDGRMVGVKGREGWGRGEGRGWRGRRREVEWSVRSKVLSAHLREERKRSNNNINA
jgi:hypothetical protein